MMKKLTVCLKNNYLLGLISFFATFILTYAFYFVYAYAPFGIDTLAAMDGHIQYVDLFAYLMDLLSGKADISYTLSNSLGGDTLAISSYYLGSPFNLLAFFFNKSQISTFFNLIVALKLSTAAFTMTIFLRSRFGQRISALFTVLLSLSYAFMQYNIAQSSNVMWLDGVYMLPLMILGVHKCITDKNSVLLSVSTALCILFNWYAAGIACLFTIIWFFYEATLFVCGQDRPCSKHTISSLLSLFFRFGIAMVTAVLLSCVTFLPTVHTLLGGKGTNLIIRNVFNGNILSVIQNYHFGAVSDIGSPALYCGSVALLGTIAFFLSKNIPLRKRITTGFLLALMLLIFFWDPFYLLFSLFNYAYSYHFRYSFISIFTIIYIAACFYSHTDEYPQKKIVSIAGLFSVLLMLLEYIKPVHDLKQIYYTAFVTLGSGVLIYTVLKTKKRNLLLSVALILVLIAELGQNAKLLMNYYREFTYPSTVGYHEAQQEQIDQLKAHDQGQYRISQTSYRYPVSYNESLAFGFWSNTGYTSCPDNRQLDFLDRLGYRKEGDCLSIAKTSIIAADSLLGTKYILSDTPINGLKPIGELDAKNGKSVYENPFCLPMAFITDFFDASAIEYTNPFDYHNELFDRLLGEKADLYLQLEAAQTTENNVTTYSFNLPEGNYAIYGNIPSSGQAQADLDVNGAYKQSYSSWLAPSVFYIPTESGDTGAYVSVSALAPQLLGTPQFYALNLDRLDTVTSLLKQGALSGVQLGTNHIVADLKADAGQYLVMSVPYADGWSITINNREIESLLLGDCFMVLPLTEGNLRINMEYSIPYLGAGIALSAIGLAALLLQIIKGRKIISH